MRAHHLVIACIGVLAACGSDEPEPRTRTEFCFDWARAACSNEVVSACQAEDVDSCRQAQESFCDGLLPDDFTDARGDACLNAVADAFADADLTGDELAVVLRLAAPCDNIIAGPGEEGDSCEAASDCNLGAGLECIIKLGQEQGVCEQPELVEAGRDCEAAQKVCEPGFFCDGSNCIEARDEGESCTLDVECGESGFCDAGECVERYGIDEPCERDVQCAAGICYPFEGENLCTDRIRLSRAEPLCQDLM